MPVDTKTKTLIVVGALFGLAVGINELVLTPPIETQQQEQEWKQQVDIDSKDSTPASPASFSTYRQEIAEKLKQTRPSQCSQLNRPWYKIKFGVGRNFGDDLNVDLAAALLGIPEDSVNRTTNRRLSPKIVAVGSVLTHVEPGDIVMGTGLSFGSKDARPNSPLWSQNLPNATILWVRGPDTRGKILEHGIDCPEMYGDLGVTSSLLIWPDLDPKPSPSKKICIIPHVTDMTLQQEAATSGHHVISITPEKPRHLVEQLMDCAFVISSSLHAIMVADTYQIGVRWYNGPDSNSPAKYLDYFKGVDVLDSPQPAKSLAEAIRMGPMKKILTLEKMREVTIQLIENFPFDRLCKA